MQQPSFLQQLHQQLLLFGSQFLGVDTRKLPKSIGFLAKLPAEVPTPYAAARFIGATGATTTAWSLEILLGFQV